MTFGINERRGCAAVIILCLYVLALWLVLSKLKLVRWGWLSGIVSGLIGVLILATFLGLFNDLTPSGRVTVTGRVLEVTPNVTGQIVAIPVKTNVPVKSGDVLFQIDPAPFQYTVKQLQASLAAARQQTQILKSNYEQATAAVAGLEAQFKYNTKRLADIQTLYASGANTEFKEQDTQVQLETVTAQLNAAKATQQSAKLALDSEIGGVNTSVAQIQAQLDNANWELSQTTIRAPADGYVRVVALTVGDRAKQSASLARTNAIGGASGFPAEISIPEDMSREALRLGMSGNATAFAANAGVIGLLASIWSGLAPTPPTSDQRRTGSTAKIVAKSLWHKVHIASRDRRTRRVDGPRVRKLCSNYRNFPMAALYDRDRHFWDSAGSPCDEVERRNDRRRCASYCG